MKLKEAKKLLNVFTSNLKEILRKIYKSKDQNIALVNIKLLYQSREVVIKLFSGYYSIAFRAK